MDSWSLESGERHFFESWLDTSRLGVLSPLLLTRVARSWLLLGIRGVPARGHLGNSPATNFVGHMFELDENDEKREQSKDTNNTTEHIVIAALFINMTGI